MDIVSRV